MTGDQKMVVRGGFGYRVRPLRRAARASAAARPTSPSSSIPTLTNGFLQDIVPGGGGALAPQAVQSASTRTPSGPTVYSYSAGVQRELGEASRSWTSRTSVRSRATILAAST